MLKKFLNFVSKLRLHLVFLLVLFLLGILINYRGVVSNCRTNLFDGPGDQVALAWAYDHSNKVPILDKTTSSDYPKTESLWSPVAVTNRAWYPYYWSLSKLSGSSICGYNLIVFSGLAFSMIMCMAFIYVFISKKYYVTGLGSYFSTFSPYIVNKSSGHLTYMYGIGLVILTVWLTILIYKRKSIKYSLVLGLLIGSMLYFDTYYLLILPVVAINLFIILLISDLTHLKNQATLLKNMVRLLTGRILPLLASVVVALLILTPGVIYLKKNSSAVNAFISATRPNLKDEATSFSMRPYDYLLPSPSNHMYPKSLLDFRHNHLHGSNIGEVVGFIGYSFITLFMIGLLVVLWKTGFKRIFQDSKDYRLLLIFIVLILVGVYWSLPPDYQPGGFIKILTPASFIVRIFDAWRVFSRFFLLTHLSFILSLVILLKIITKNFSFKNNKKLGFVVLFLTLISFAEYSARTPFSNIHWNQSSTIPHTYTSLKNSSGEAVAEYPIKSMLPFFQAYQSFYNKKLFNPTQPFTSDWQYKQQLLDLDNPQTVPILYYMGVDNIHVYWQDQPKPIKNLGLIDSSNYSLDPSFTMTNMQHTKYMTSLYSIDSTNLIDNISYLTEIRPDKAENYIGTNNQVTDISYPLNNTITIKFHYLCDNKKDYNLIRLSCTGQKPAYKQNFLRLNARVIKPEDTTKERGDAGNIILVQDGKILINDYISYNKISYTIPIIDMSKPLFVFSNSGNAPNIEDVYVETK